MDDPLTEAANPSHTEVISNSDNSICSIDSPFQSSSNSDIEDNTQTPPPSSPPHNRGASSPTLYDDTSSPSQKIVQSASSSSSSPQEAFQIDPEFLINPHAIEASYFTRANRYFGPDSTWLSWTETERAVYWSLERSKAQDLSAHLYNAFDLKRQSLRDQVAEAKGKSNEKEAGEEEQGEEEEEEEEEETFETPEMWTAWPLPSEEVPRVDFVRGLDGLNSRGKDRTCRTELEECLIAATQRKFRESWKRNEDMIQEQRVRDSESNDDQPNAMRGKQTQAEPGLDMLMQDDTAANRADGSSDPSASSKSLKPALPDSGITYFSSQVFAASQSSTSSEESDSGVSEVSTRLIPTIDDDYARELLLPEARHLVSTLDDLLLALHTSQAWRAYDHGSQENPRSRSEPSTNSETEPEGESVEATPGNQAPSHHKDKYATRPFTSSSPRKPRSKSKTSNDSTSRSRSQSQSRSPSRSKSVALPLLDWKFIIQQANILNLFTPATIKRASKRCARLFDEDILISTIHETDPDKRGISRPYIDEYCALDTTDESDKEDDDDEEDKTDSAKSKQVRTSAACTYCETHKTKCQPPPTRSMTDEEEDTTVSCEACIKAEEPCSGIESEVRARDIPYGPVCPYTRCSRHAVEFKKPSDLKRHLTLSHGGEMPSSASARSNLRRSDSSLSTHSADREICCPVDGCSRAEGTDRPFKTTSNMYKHVRGMHPSLDMEEVKRAELLKKGDRRGRWTDERRHRSRSKARSSDSQGELGTDGTDD